MSATVTMEQAAKDAAAVGSLGTVQIVGDYCHVTMYRQVGETDGEWYARVSETRMAMQTASERAQSLFPNLFPKADGVEGLTDADYGSDAPFADDDSDEEDCE